jgi:hypothetical protein
LSKDPEFVDKLRDGLYVDPRAHAVVLSVDEKSQSRPSIARPPGLPMKKGRAGTMTHDDKRHGTTTLFAAMLGALERDAGSALAPPARLRRPTTDPRRGPRKDHVVLLREAEKQVDMAAYVLTDAVIEALRDASTRGGEGTGLARRERGGVLLQTAR